MANGQPTSLPPYILKFNTSTLKMRDNDTLEDTVIVRAGVPFDLYLSFSGTGIIWDWAQYLHAPYKVSYFAEGHGGELDTEEKKLGIREANLSYPHPGEYTDAETKIAAVINKPGIYELSAMVTFPGGRGVTGFVSGLMIEVYE